MAYIDYNRAEDERADERMAACMATEKSSSRRGMQPLWEQASRAVEREEIVTLQV